MNRFFATLRLSRGSEQSSSSPSRRAVRATYIGVVRALDEGPDLLNAALARMDAAVSVPGAPPEALRRLLDKGDNHRAAVAVRRMIAEVPFFPLVDVLGERFTIEADVWALAIGAWCGGACSFSLSLRRRAASARTVLLSTSATTPCHVRTA